jgi:hypothetical protein
MNVPVPACLIQSTAGASHAQQETDIPYRGMKVSFRARSRLMETPQKTNTRAQLGQVHSPVTAMVEGGFVEHVLENLEVTGLTICIVQSGIANTVPGLKQIDQRRLRSNS